MTATQALRPAGPIDVRPQLDEVGRRLVDLLHSLPADAWELPTVCPGWRVRDVAAHLLDGALRRLSFERDAMAAPPPDRAIGSTGDLVAFLNGLNATWVAAAARLSPRLLADLMEATETWLAAHVRTLDLEAEARFPVAWAGQDTSRVWFDLARELTERWHHQQQIRLAAGAPALDDPQLSEPVFETFLHAVPHRLRGVPAADGAALAVTVRGARDYPFTVVRRGGAWTLLRGAAEPAAASVLLAEEPAWRLLTRGLPAAAARAGATTAGDETLVAAFFDVLAVMA